ncbi:hypothetical protein GCM10011329_02980 [Stakelama pacifica]|nr:hypothetical protein GCM10011329_02980 [Stakelama pacifica]
MKAIGAGVWNGGACAAPGAATMLAKRAAVRSFFILKSNQKGLRDRYGCAVSQIGGCEKP